MKAIWISALAIALSACATSSPDVISRNDAQRMSTVQDATVVSVRTVTIDGSQSGVGTVAGAVVGGVAGSTIGGGRGAIIAGTLGAVAGGMAGNAVERNVTREQAVEIIVELRNGERRAIVQAIGNENFFAGDPVTLVTSGGTTRVSRAAR